MSITVTSLTSYEYCPRKFYLTTVLKLAEPPKEAIVKGTIRHNAVEEINISEPMLVFSIDSYIEFADLIKKYKSIAARSLRKTILSQKKLIDELGMDKNDLYEKSMEILLSVISERAKAVHDFMSKYHIFGKELWTNMTPKIRSELSIKAKDLGIHGRIDSLYDFKDYVVPSEIKTGSAPSDGVWPSHRIQIAAYQMILRELGYRIRTGEIFYIDHGIKREIMLNPFLEDSVKDLRDKVILCMNSDNVPDKVKNKNKCKSCPMKDKCDDEQYLNQKLSVLFH